MGDQASPTDTNRDETADDEVTQEVPEPIVEEVLRYTQRAREAEEDDRTEAILEARNQVLDPYDFEIRVREETHDVLVLYPAEWIEDGTVVMEHIEDTDRAIERPLEGTGVGETWDEVYEHNKVIAQRVRAEFGDDHGANAAALAEYMSNHYLKPIEEATRGELEEFLTEYYPRNVWPTADQKRVVRQSVQFVYDCLDVPSPL